MLLAYPRALGNLGHPRIVRILGACLLLSVVVFAALAGGIAWLLSQTELTSIAIVDSLVKLLGNVATIVAAFFLFPVAMSLFVGLFLERVAAVVESTDYPDLPPAPGLGMLRGLVATLRFLAKAIVVNLVLLLFLFVPVLYPFAWFAANSYLLGREYFELVALRRLDAATARTLRRRHRISVLLGGLVAIGLFALPVVNFLAPVIVTIAMVHAFEGWRRSAATG